MVTVALDGRVKPAHGENEDRSFLGQVRLAVYK